MRITYLTLLLSVAGCSGAQVKQRTDGTYAIDCGSRKACLDRADRICQPGGYTLVGGKSNKKRYGVPGNEKYIGKDEIYVRCNKDRPADTPDLEAGTWRLKHEGEEAAPAPPAAPANAPAAAAQKPVPPESSAAPSAPRVKPVCRPGETQRCVGPGACDGGQACLADGSGFAPCDCGTTTPKTSP